jgi:hypothetical protein
LIEQQISQINNKNFESNLHTTKSNKIDFSILNNSEKHQNNPRLSFNQKIRQTDSNQFENQMHKQIFMNNKHKSGNMRKSLETSIFKDVDFLERDEVNENI